MSASEGRAASPDGWGVIPAYEDADGRWQEVPRTTRDALVEAMGGDPSRDGPPSTDGSVLVVRIGETPPVPDRSEVVLEDGDRRVVGDRLPGDLPAGYHELRSPSRDDPTRLIVSPGVCHLPPGLRWWGVAAQHYALWSEGSEGIGDLVDLRLLATWLGDVGADTLMVSPVGAAVPVTPRDASPYLPSSRRFLDWLAIRVAEVPGAETLPRSALPGPPTGAIDRDTVAARKLAALADCFAAAGADPGLDDWVARADSSLVRFAAWSVAAEQHGADWQRWPAQLRHPDRGGIDALVRDEPTRVRFHLWLQWCADRQLAAAAEPLRLARDLPIGASRTGFDTWEHQDVVAEGVTVGAPPDLLGPEGQDWRIPAMAPWRLRAAAYGPFIQVLRASLRHAGALRIDHVLGLFRLFWIPRDTSPAEGAYVAQPTQELFDILALESQRAGAVIIGEDLGTVGVGVREQLAARQVLRYHVGWFEDAPPARWTSDSLASLSTHDLPTVAGVWTGEDERELAAMGRHVDTDWYAELRAELAAMAPDGRDSSLDQILVAAHRALAAAPSAIVLAQLEDLLGVDHRPNVPGTEPPVRVNWSTPLPEPVGSLAADARVTAIVEALAATRTGR